MKRISKILAVVMLIALSLFVSCDNSMQVSDGIASVRFASGTEDGNARSLSRVNPVFEAENLYWMYTAKKIDNSGLSTGEVLTPTTVGTDGKLTSSVGPFSLGDWEFTLYAYTDSIFEKLAYKGSTTARLVKSDSGNSVSVTVSAMKTSGGTGYIAFPEKGGISLTDSNGHAVASYDEFITITNIENSGIAVNGVKNSEERVFEVASGAYKVTVAYCDVDDNTLKYGENSIYVNVWDNLTTTIGGSLDEITSDTTFNPSDGTASAGETISEGSVTTIAVDSSPANLDSTDSEEKTTVVIPANATDAGNAMLTVKPYTIENVGDFIIETEEGKAVVGGLDLKLVVGDATVATFNEAVTVTTYIAKGLSGVTVKYNGDESQPTDISYVAGTGELTFKTTHFSEFYITTSSVVFNKNKGKAYLSIDDAISCADSGDEIMLLNDIKRDVYVEINKSITINGGDKKYGIYIYGADTSSSSTKRGFLISSGDITVNLLNLVVDARTEVTSGTGYPRGINAYNENGIKNLKLNIKNCDISALYYAINLTTSCEDVLINVEDSTILGWAALNIWGHGSQINIERTKLIGINDKAYNAEGWNDFSTICVESDTTGMTDSAATNTSISINNSMIQAYSTTGNNQQHIGFNDSNSENNVVSITNTLFLDEKQEIEPSYYNGGLGNYLYIDDVLINKVLKRNCWYSNGPFSSDKNTQGSMSTDFTLPFDQEWLASGEGIILEDDVVLETDVVCLLEGEATIYLYFSEFNLSGGQVIIKNSVSVISDRSDLVENNILTVKEGEIEVIPLEDCLTKYVAKELS